MAIGNSYPVRPVIQAQDLFLGTKYGSNSTVNYTTDAIVDYLNTNASIAVGGQLTYQFLTDTYVAKSIFFVDGDGNNTPFSSITQLIISNGDCSGSQTNIFLDYLVNEDILLSEQNTPNNFGHYKIIDYYVSDVNSNFYVLDLQYIGGNGVISENIYYTICPFSIADLPNNGLPAGGTAGQILTKVDATDYNATWQENFADWTSQVKHIVKNNGLAGTITKGTAVYVTGSNGTNMLVGRASNTSEATSSKTMGLMQSDITTTGSNQTGFVITEGLLEGLDTSGHIAGEPVWLGVNGSLIYGLANKPYAPAHLVFIGIVTKISAGNGEIFVKVQNGFELKEIHDVDIVTNIPVNGDVLGFDGTLWVNKTVAGWLGYTPANLAGDTFTGNIDAPSMSIGGTDIESLMIAYAVALG